MLGFNLPSLTTSKTVLGKFVFKFVFCGTYEIRDVAFFGLFPNISIWPLSGVNNLKRLFKSVLFPPPCGKMMVS